MSGGGGEVDGTPEYIEDTAVLSLAPKAIEAMIHGLRILLLEVRHYPVPQLSQVLGQTWPDPRDHLEWVLGVLPHLSKVLP